MTTVAIAALRKTFSDTLNRVAYQGERIGLERHGKVVAVLVSVADHDLLRALEDRIDLEAAEKSLSEPGEDESFEDLKKELGL